MEWLRPSVVPILDICGANYLKSGIFSPDFKRWGHLKSDRQKIWILNVSGFPTVRF